MVDASVGSFDQLASTYRDAIEGELRRALDFGEGCPERLLAAMDHSLMAPGKRLRPILVLSAAAVCGCDARRALPASAAVELIHTYSLIHDDLPAMDDDDMRRGRPSCHAAFDEATAILAGDALLTRAFEILARDIRPAEVAVRCCQDLAHAAGGSQMVGGQADDLAAEGQAGSLAELEAIHRRKTGAMLAVSLRLGAHVAQADDAALERLSAYGRDLGLAFQIVDDLLDETGETATIGKRTGQDQQRGKLTFPALLGEQESRRRAAQLIESAIHQLAPWGSQAAPLIGLAQFVLQRKR